jgi:hypothetical protein
MRNAIWAVAAGLGLILATAAGAQTPPAKSNDTRIESQPADAMSRTPDENTARKPGTDSKGPGKGDGVTVGKDGDPIGATNDDKGRQGEAHSDPTLATKPAPPSDPKFQ